MDKIGKEYHISNLDRTRVDLLMGGKDAVVGSKVVPNVNMSWAFTEVDEFWINLNRKNVTVTNEKETFQNNELSLKIGDETNVWKLKYVVLDYGDGLPRTIQALAWDITLDKKPASNAIEWDMLCSPGLEFLYQDTIENEWRPETGVTLQEYLDQNHRPENVVGSYAIFCNKRNNAYRTGKVAHVFRPECTDSLGKKTWADLFVDPSTNLLRITIPQKFIDTAVYPIHLDPDIGYDGQGASTGNVALKTLCARETADSTCTLATIHMYCKNTDSSTHNILLCIYENGGNPGAQLAAEAGPISLAASFDGEKSAAYTPAIVATTDYFVAWMNDEWHVQGYHDAIAWGEEKWENTGSFDMPVANPSVDGQGTRGWNIWGTCAAGGGISVPVAYHHLDKNIGR